jgi:hypothetical protein
MQSVAEPKSKYEILAEHQSSHGPIVTQVRGSLIASSLETLRQLHLFDRYIALLPPEYHDQILYVVAASWVPLDAAMAHYKACDEMQLSEHELQEIGSYVSKRIMGTFLGTLMRTASAVIAPGSALRHYPRLWDRLLWGGGCTVSMMDGRDARIESRGVAMFRYRYFRIAYTGLIRGAATVFKESVHARIRNATDNSLTIDITWL